MYYQASFETPANTSEDDPLLTVLRVTRGKLIRAIVGFAPGAVGLLHIKVKDKGFQIVPMNLTESLAWDNYVFDLALNYKIQVEPFELSIYSWNNDDTYPHTSFVGFEIIEGSANEGILLHQYPLNTEA